MSDQWECQELSGVRVGLGFEGLETDSASELPEVQTASALGWEPAPEAGLWCFLPAIWPTGARAWLPDRRVRGATGSASNSGPARRSPWSAATYAGIEADRNELLAECGFPPRPFGRVWLLRPPPSWVSVDALLDDVLDRWRASGGEVLADRRFAEHTRVVVDEAFTHQD
jgi:hypothetical protein